MANKSKLSNKKIKINITIDQVIDYSKLILISNNNEVKQINNCNDNEINTDQNKLK